ncbi:MAG: Na+/H+ antiporter [Anaerolineales bacterium]
MDIVQIFRGLFQENEPDIIEYQLIFIILILIITVVAIAVRIRRVKIPYTVALVSVGLGLSLIPETPDLNITGELILALFVPPLIFEAALHIGWTSLRKNLLPILLLAAPGVLIATFIVGRIVTLRLDIPLALALAFGALISATDPVAVIAFFRSLGVSKRLAVLVEGESLLNDGIAIVIFTIAVGLASGGETDLTLLDAVWEFIRVAGGGVIIGLVLGGLVSLLLSRLDDSIIETTMTMTVAFGAYVLAETFHMSGILAVVSAGVYVGSVGLKNISPTTQIALDNFWEFLSFVANSIVFLLIGLRINIIDLWTRPILISIGIAILAIIISRSLVVYLMSWLSTRFGNHIPIKYRHVMFWGGLRGAVSLALALSLEGPGAEQIRLMTFGVVLFTLLVQGLSIESLIKRLNLSEITQEAEQQHALADLFTSRAARSALSRLHQNGLIADTLWQPLVEINNERIQDILENHPEMEQRLIIETRREMLKASRTALVDMFRRNVLSEDIYRHELTMIDRRILVWDRIESRFKKPGNQNLNN